MNFSSYSMQESHKYLIKNIQSPPFKYNYSGFPASINGDKNGINEQA